MIDEMICAFDSPGSVSTVVIIPPDIREDARQAGATRTEFYRGFSAVCRPYWLAAESASATKLAAASLSNESASSMPIPNSE
jgi:hypothetical protein